MSALIDLSGPLAPPPAPSASPPEQSSSTTFVAAPAPPPAPTPLIRGSSGVPLTPIFRPPLIPDVESTAAWDSHLAALRAYYAPEGYAEDATAFTIAALQWRLNRLVRSETDDLAHSIAAAEADAAALVASRAAEPAHIHAVLPTSAAALRRCVKEARLASQTVPGYHTWPNHDPIS